jgi:hypothetical protein
MMRRLSASLRLLVMPVALAGLCHCGLDSLAGGASEVGNPNTAIHKSAKQDTTSRKVTGVEIDFQGSTIRLRREEPKSSPDSSNSSSIPKDENESP